MGLDSRLRPRLAKSHAAPAGGGGAGRGQATRCRSTEVGVVLVSVKDPDKAANVVERLKGWSTSAPGRGDRRHRRRPAPHGIRRPEGQKVLEGRDPRTSSTDEGREVQLVVKHRRGAGALTDSFKLRSTALMHKTPLLHHVSRAQRRCRRHHGASEGAGRGRPCNSLQDDV